MICVTFLAQWLACSEGSVNASSYYQTRVKLLKSPLAYSNQILWPFTWHFTCTPGLKSLCFKGEYITILLEAFY